MAQAKKKPVTDIMQWVQCYGRYVAGMSAKYPESVPGFLSHMLTVVKAFVEVEEPAWRLYDEAYREKMAATGVKKWKGMDVGLYQEVCGGRVRKASGAPGIKRKAGDGCCWKYNEGKCTYGKSCKFLHRCEVCSGEHSKLYCKKPRLG